MRYSALASCISNRTFIIEKPPHPGSKWHDNRDGASDDNLITCSPWSNWGALLGRRPRATHPWVQAAIDRVARCHNLRYYQLSQKVHNAPGNRFSVCTLWVATQYMTRHVPLLTRSQQRATLYPGTLTANSAPAPEGQNDSEILALAGSLAGD